MTRPAPRRRHRRRQGYDATPLSGFCARCDEPILDYRQAVKVRGRWIHKGCASGADE